MHISCDGDVRWMQQETRISYELHENSYLSIPTLAKFHEWQKLQNITAHAIASKKLYFQMNTKTVSDFLNTCHDCKIMYEEAAVSISFNLQYTG